jgi:hypothetical protein
MKDKNTRRAEAFEAWSTTPISNYNLNPPSYGWEWHHERVARDAFEAGWDAATGKNVLNVYLPEVKRDASDLKTLQKVAEEITEVIDEILRRAVMQEVEFHLLLCLGDAYVCQSTMPKADIPWRLRAHAINHEVHDMPAANTEERPS